MTYTALNNAVWFGSEFVCNAATINYAEAIAEALNKKDLPAPARR